MPSRAGTHVDVHADNGTHGTEDPRVMRSFWRDAEKQQQQEEKAEVGVKMTEIWNDGDGLDVFQHAVAADARGVTPTPYMYWWSPPSRYDRPVQSPSTGGD